MSTEVITPGYAWAEITPEQTLTGLTEGAPTPIDLHTLYPIVDGELLQKTWDAREVKDRELKSGTHLTTVTFNQNAEGGSLLWLPGWGVSNLEGGGARVATILAALNPNKRVIAGEELEHIPAYQRREAKKGNMAPYASNYLFATDKDTDTLSGHSRGGIIQAHLANRDDIRELKVVNMMDMPRALGYRSMAQFGILVGGKDNGVQSRYMHLSDEAEEALVEQSISEGLRESGGIPEVLKKAWKQRSLVKALSQAGLGEVLELAIANQPQAEFFIWHGTKNIGAPVEATREMLDDIRASLTPAEQARLHYFESPTGHYSEGHTGRYPRQTAYSLRNSTH